MLNVCRSISSSSNQSCFKLNGIGLSAVTISVSISKLFMFIVSKKNIDLEF